MKYQTVAKLEKLKIASRLLREVQAEVEHNYEFDQEKEFCFNSVTGAIISTDNIYNKLVEQANITNVDSFPKIMKLDNKEEVYVIGYSMDSKESYIFQYKDSKKMDWAPVYRLSEI